MSRSLDWLKYEHSSKQWNSSPSAFLEQISHFLLSISMLDYRPVSIGSLWLHVRNLAILRYNFVGNSLK